MIDRRPEEFKIACLTDVALLFYGSLDVGTPFTAGFGNRMTDVVRLVTASIFLLTVQGLVQGCPYQS